MAGNGGLDGRSAQSLVGCCDDEARIFFLLFLPFGFSYVSLFPQKLSSACDGVHITVEYNDKGGLFSFFLFFLMPYEVHRNYFPQLQCRTMIGTSKNKVQKKFDSF